MRDDASGGRVRALLHDWEQGFDGDRQLSKTKMNLVRRRGWRQQRRKRARGKWTGSNIVKWGCGEADGEWACGVESFYAWCTYCKLYPHYLLQRRVGNSLIYMYIYPKKGRAESCSNSLPFFLFVASHHPFIRWHIKCQIFSQPCWREFKNGLKIKRRKENEKKERKEKKSAQPNHTPVFPPFFLFFLFSFFFFFGSVASPIRIRMGT